MTHEPPREPPRDPRQQPPETLPPAYKGIPSGIPPEPYEAPRHYQAFPGSYGPYGDVPPSGPRTNVLAIVSLIASIISCGIGSLVAVICGHIALRQIRRTGEAGRGLAITGLVLGYLGLLAALVVLLVALLVGFSAENSSS